MVQWDKPSRVRTDHVTTRTIVLSHNQQTIAQQAPAKYSRLSHSYMYSGLILKNSIHAAVDSHSPLQKKHEKAEHCFAVIGSYMNCAAETQREAPEVLEIPTGPPVRGRQLWRRTGKFLLIFLPILCLWFEILGMRTYNFFDWVSNIGSTSLINIWKHKGAYWALWLLMVCSVRHNSRPIVSDGLLWLTDK